MNDSISENRSLTGGANIQTSLQFFSRADDAVVCINPKQRVSTLLKLLKLTGTTFSLTEATAETAVAATAWRWRPNR